MTPLPQRLCIVLPSVPHMATFRSFRRLPLELRAHIWESTIEPRTVDVRYEKEWQAGVGYRILHVISSTSVPTTLQTCQEVRNSGLYRRAFSHGNDARYVWVNFDVDTISIGRDDFDLIEPEQPLIRQLTFKREDCEAFFHVCSKNLGRFSNVGEVHIICEEGLMTWQEPWNTYIGHIQVKD